MTLTQDPNNQIVPHPFCDLPLPISLQTLKFRGRETQTRKFSERSHILKFREREHRQRKKTQLINLATQTLYWHSKQPFSANPWANRFIYFWCETLWIVYRIICRRSSSATSLSSTYMHLHASPAIFNVQMTLAFGSRKKKSVSNSIGL